MGALAELTEKAACCTRCALYERATGTVFGEGSSRPRLFLVGEQPGDSEDLAGRPFVGPAGRLLDKALAEAGVDRSDCYLTNAVKHFKWEQRGKRRLHKRPNRTEVVACRYWLEGELAVLRPAVAVALGVVAGSSLIGPHFTLAKFRGVVTEAQVGEWRGAVVATAHPAALLRTRDAAARRAGYAGLVADIEQALALAGSGAG